MKSSLGVHIKIEMSSDGDRIKLKFLTTETVLIRVLPIKVSVQENHGVSVRNTETIPGHCVFLEKKFSV